jgi:hypothetical protein
MASIMTNASALTALQSLNATNKNLETTQSRISTGFRVAEASDNAAYWSIATTMRSDNKALGDRAGRARSRRFAKVDTAYTGINKPPSMSVDEIKVKARRSHRREPIVDKLQDPDRGQRSCRGSSSRQRLIAATFTGDQHGFRWTRPPPAKQLDQDDRLGVHAHRSRNVSLGIEHDRRQGRGHPALRRGHQQPPAPASA